MFGEGARKHWENNQWEESKPQRRNWRVRTLSGHHFRLLSTGPCLHVHCCTVHCLASSQRSLTSPWKGTTSFPSTRTERAVQGSPHNACIRLVSTSRPSERHAVDTVGVDLFVIYRGRACLWFAADVRAWPRWPCVAWGIEWNFRVRVIYQSSSSSNLSRCNMSLTFHLYSFSVFQCLILAVVFNWKICLFLAANSKLSNFDQHHNVVHEKS